MKTILKSALLVFLSIFTISVNAQMTINAEVRTRTEFRHGYQALIDSGQGGSAFTSQRTRLNFGYAAEKFKIGISVQDVRFWGSQSQLNTTDGYTSIHEAWGQYWFVPKFSIKAGRQELNYNDERLFGSTNWLQQARSHDLFLLAYEDTTHKFIVHFGEAYNANPTAGNLATTYGVTNSYKEMQYLWLNKKFGAMNASLIVVNNGAQSPITIGSTRYFQTAGTYLEYKKKALFASGRFYYQMGTDAAKKDMKAIMAGVDVAYTLKEKLIFGLGFEMLSGQSQTDTTKAYKDIDHIFNPLYGTGHKFNGYMDYFYAGSAFGNVGLNDIYFKAKYKTDKFQTGLDVHMFMAAADVLDAKELATSGKYTAMNANLGTEIDFTFAYNFSKIFNVQVGYSQMLASETMKAIKGGENGLTQNWAYLMLTFKPSMLK